MKRIIQNRVYDTETAKLMGTYDSGYGVRDFNYYEESLYQKRTGEFFLYGWGGGLSPYARAVGDSLGSGESIKPFSYEEARAWAEEHLEADEYLSIFDPEPDDEKAERDYRFTLPAESSAIVDRLRSDGRTIRQVFIDLLNEKK